MTKVAYIRCYCFVPQLDSTLGRSHSRPYIRTWLLPGVTACRHRVFKRGYHTSSWITPLQLFIQAPLPEFFYRQRVLQYSILPLAWIYCFANTRTAQYIVLQTPLRTAFSLFIIVSSDTAATRKNQTCDRQNISQRQLPRA